MKFKTKNRDETILAFISCSVYENKHIFSTEKCIALAKQQILCSKPLAPNSEK